MYKPYESDLTERVLGASPLELTQMLYTEARRAIGKARACNQRGDHSGRSEAVSQAMDIVAELNSSLDSSRGSDLTARLRSIYAWVLAQLAAGHVQQSERPLREAEEVLGVLDQAWREVRQQTVSLNEVPAVPAGDNPHERRYSFAA